MTTSPLLSASISRRRCFAIAAATAAATPPSHRPRLFDNLIFLVKFCLFVLLNDDDIVLYHCQ